MRLNGSHLAAERLTSKYNSADPVVSPDGTLIAYEHYDDKQGWHTAILPADGGEPLKIFDWHAFRDSRSREGRPTHLARCQDGPERIRKGPNDCPNE